MATKTLTTILFVIAAVFCIPLAIGLIGGVIGLIAGMFGAFIGVIAGIFGAIAGTIGWIFDGAFHWPFWHINANILTIATIVLIVVLVTKSKRK